MRRFHVLACDYDGTLARHGRVDDATLAGLERLRQSGRRMVMVTGRRLSELLEILPAPRLFDRIVAENGAVILTPETGAELLLAEPPPARFIEMLTNRGVAPLAVGRTIVATWEPHETQVLATIRDLGLGLHIVLNKGAVMVLPSGVSKATGLKKALDEMGYSPRNVVAVGDAENDHALLEYCECGAAVANAVPALKERADIVLERDHGDGVIDLMEQLLADDLAAWTAGLSRRRLELGILADGQPLIVPATGVNLSLESRKLEDLAPLVERLTSQLSLHDYQWCAVAGEPYFHHAGSTIAIGAATRAPSLEEAAQGLERPRQSAIVHCGALNTFERGPFVSALAEKLQEMRRHLGRPHWVLWCGLRSVMENLALDLDAMGPGMVLVDQQRDDEQETDDPANSHWLRIIDRRQYDAAEESHQDAAAPRGTTFAWIDSENGVLRFAARSPQTERRAP